MICVRCFWTPRTPKDSYLVEQAAYKSEFLINLNF